MQRCNCTHVSQCPFTCDPLELVYPDGSKVFRVLGPTEDRNLQLGDAVQKPSTRFSHRWRQEISEGGGGVLFAAARAIDPSKAVAYARAKLGRRCKGEIPSWRHFHGGE